MNRRELLELLAVAVPALAGLSADQRAVLEQSLSRARRRGLFDPRQFDTVDQLSEIIIPATDTPAQRTRWSIATSTSFSPRHAIRRKMNWVRLLWNDGQPAQNHAFRLM